MPGAALGQHSADGRVARQETLHSLTGTVIALAEWGSSAGRQHCAQHAWRRHVSLQLLRLQDLTAQHPAGALAQSVPDLGALQASLWSHVKLSTQL